MECCLPHDLGHTAHDFSHSVIHVDGLAHDTSWVTQPHTNTNIHSWDHPGVFVNFVDEINLNTVGGHNGGHDFGHPGHDFPHTTGHVDGHTYDLGWVTQPHGNGDAHTAPLTEIQKIIQEDNANDLFINKAFGLNLGGDWIQTFFS